MQVTSKLNNGLGSKVVLGQVVKLLSSIKQTLSRALMVHDYKPAKFLVP